MEKIWLKSYPEGVPETVDTNRFNDLTELFAYSCEEYADRNAMFCLGTHWKYDTLYRQARLFARFLQNHLGLQKGDRFAIMMPNLPQYPVALYGILMAGLTVVNVNPMYTARELSHQLKDAGVSGILILANFTQTLEKALQSYSVKHIVVTQVGDMLPGMKRHLINFILRHVKRVVPKTSLKDVISFNEALELGDQTSLSQPTLKQEDLAFLQYTGGTTGVPKGAMLTHGNILANVEQVLAWVKDYIKSGEEVVVTALPLYHIFSLTVCGLAFVAFGSCSILIPNPRDFKAFIKTLKQHPFTIFIGVNTLFNGLLDQQEFKALDFSKFKFAIGGGMAVQSKVAERWEQVTGKPIIEGYGLTETSPVVTINPFDKSVRGSIGLPAPSTEVIICDDEGNPLPVGGKGELCVKGPQVMPGYWERPEETQNAFTKDGFFKTGDMAYLNEKGFVYLVDRKKDMIVVSGFNVYPAEVEEVLCSHPDVKEAGVIGVEDEKSGEAVKAFVVVRHPEVTEETLKAHCRENLTRYKVPKYFEFCDELPKTNVGKILRRALKEGQGTS